MYRRQLLLTMLSYGLGGSAVLASGVRSAPSTGEATTMALQTENAIEIDLLDSPNSNAFATLTDDNTLHLSFTGRYGPPGRSTVWVDSLVRIMNVGNGPQPVWFDTSATDVPTIAIEFYAQSEAGRQLLDSPAQAITLTEGEATIIGLRMELGQREHHYPKTPIDVAIRTVSS